MNYDRPDLTLITSEILPGAIRWRSPSNIALVKYWGKYGDQLPRNASVSFTLDGAATDTTLFYEPSTAVDGKIKVDVALDGQPNAGFSERTASFFERLLPIYPFLKQLSFRVKTSNSFPHSAGIASSASGLSALALCLVDLEEKLFQPLESKDAFWRKASYIARLGSGSACRSVYGGAAVWGKIDTVENSGEEYAVSVKNALHPVFQDYHDDILLISKSEKSVSSRAGHSLMEGNPYAEARYGQANRRTARMMEILRNGDIEEFGQLTESEALTLHSLMMSSSPPYLLIQPNTLKVIERLQQFRVTANVPIYFTLDAGPNLHLLYPNQYATEVKRFIRDELLYFCEDKMYLADRVGRGPEKLEVNV